MEFLSASVAVSVDDSKLSSQLGRVRRTVSKTVRSITKDVGRISTSFKNAFNQMVRHAKWGALAATGAIAASTRIFASFEAELANVSTMLSDQSMYLLPSYAERIKDLSVTYGESADILAKALYNILSASVASTKALDVLNISARAAKAGITETSTAAYAITGILNAYGYSADKAADVSDVLFSTVKAGQTTFAELATAVGRVTAIAATSGVALEEVGAALSTITRAGIDTNEAVTSLRAAIAALTGKGEAAIEVARAHGIELSTQALQAKGLKGALEELATLDDEVLKKIFREMEARVALNVLLKDQAGFLKDYKSALESSGATLEAYTKQESTLSTALSRTWQSIIAVGRALGDALAPAVKYLTDKIRGLAKQLTQWLSENKEAIGKWAHRLLAYTNYAMNVLVNFVTFMRQDFGAAWGLVWDTLVETMKMVVKEIVTLSIAAGKGIWAGIKAGLLPDKEDTRAILEEYRKLGGKMKVEVAPGIMKAPGTLEPPKRTVPESKVLWEQARMLVQQEALARKTESLTAGLGEAMAEHVRTYTSRVKELLAQSDIDITESHRQLLADLQALESEYQPTLWQRMKESATEAYESIKAKAQELQEHLKKTQTETANQTRKLTEVQEQMYSQMAAGMAREFSSTIDQMIFEAKRFEDAMVDMARSILRMILQIMVFKKIAEPLAYGIMGLPVPGTEAATAAHVPAVQTGGYVERGGLAKIHTGETVLPAGRTGTPDITINMVNQSGRPLQATEARGQFLGMKEFVIDVVVDDIARYGKSRQAIGTMFKRS